MMGDLYMEMDRNGLHSEAAEEEEYETSHDYMKRFIKALKGLGFFDLNV